MKVVGRTGLEPARHHGTPRGAAGQHYDPELPSSHAAIQPVATGCLKQSRLQSGCQFYLLHHRSQIVLADGRPPVPGRRWPPLSRIISSQPKPSESCTSRSRWYHLLKLSLISAEFALRVGYASFDMPTVMRGFCCSKLGALWGRVPTTLHGGRDGPLSFIAHCSWITLVGVL